MEVGGRSIVEGADREVQHPESGFRVAQDRAVGFRGLYLLAPCGDEAALRQVAQVDRHQVDQNDHAEQRYEPAPSDPSQGEEQHAARREGDHYERAPGIGAHDRGPVGGHGVGRHLSQLFGSALCDGFLHTCGLEHLVVLAAHEIGGFRPAEVEDRAAGHGEEQAETARDASGPGEGPQEFSTRHLSPPEGHQSQRREQGNRPFDHHEGHRYGAELVVAGQVFEGEFGESHEIMSPGQQKRQQTDGCDPPLVASRCQQESQQSQEQGGGAQVGRSGSVGLLPPVGGQLLRDTLQPVRFQGLGYLAVACERPTRIAAHEVGNQQVPAFGASVAPGRSVIECQPFLGGFLAGGEFRTAADGLFRVVHRVPQRSEVRADGQNACGQQYRRAADERRQVLFSEGDDSFADPQRGHGQQEIVGDLRMVGADFERGEEGRKRSAEPHVTPQRKPCAAHHQGGIYQCPHFGHVTRADDEEKVGRKAVHERRNDADPGIHPDDREHQPHGNHGEEDEGCGSIYNFNDLSCRVFD